MASKMEIVYSLLRRVPRGKITTYGALAKAAGTHPRAIAMFMKHNPDPVKTPCYKVVRSDGSLGGYSGRGGVKTKAQLLRKDGITLRNGKIDLKRQLHRF
ncbi:MAG: MGMT family protein [Candidatus Aenigmarchaeota archaeon]|nr:MGMT family protein [Candidatus Aenigmarchaeota archaeon]